MTQKEFDAIVKDAVANGADPKEAAEYVAAGFKTSQPAAATKDKGEGIKAKAKPKA